MEFFKALAAAFSTYSAIPMPRLEWDGGAAKYVLCCFPAVGLVCGGALWAWYALCRALGAGGALFAAVAVCLPLLLTGGIHMDGFMDTVDAISSHQTQEKKLEILKDPHCGAFAVIWCGIYLLLGFGLFHGLYAAEAALVVLPGYTLSRALSALCAVTLPSASGSGMLYAFTGGRRNPAVTVSALAWAALALGGMLLLGAPLPGLCAGTAALLSMLAYRAIARRLFGGVTGDTAGFFLQLCELAILLGAWIGSIF